MLILFNTNLELPKDLMDAMIITNIS